MNKKIIGRKDEITTLERAIKSEKPEMIAVYGRRRVGKTYLIKEYFNSKFDFYATGIFEGRQKEEIRAFCEGFDKKFLDNRSEIKNWMDAFVALKDYTDRIRKKNIIIFLDELPWFDVPPGHFLKALEWFWNSYGSTKKGLKLIVCGSATAWMRNKFISSKGGLYNRTTTQIYLQPFNLKTTQELLRFYKIKWSEAMVLETYMVFGGIPYYLSLLDKDISLDKNIDRLFFGEKAPLRNEYDFLLKSLYKESGYYKTLLDTIAKKNKGITRKEIIATAGIADNGVLTKSLKNLIDCDFLREYTSFEKTQRDSIYQLIDPMVLFYKRFVEKYKGKDSDYWLHNTRSPSQNTWRGLAYELVCLLHTNEIKKALGINGISTWIGSWYFKGNENLPGGQIDLLIDRIDNTINICEVKFSERDFEVTKKLAEDVRKREMVFLNVTKSRKSISNILLTPWGEKKGKHDGLFTQVVTLRDLLVF